VRLLAAEVRASLLELLRYPAYSIPTLVFPATLYLVVAGRSRVDPAARMVGFAAIGVLGVAFFQFGVGIAHERSRPWERYLRTLPAPPSARVLGRVLSALVFACGSAGAVVVAGAATGVALPGSRLGAVAGALVLGAVPFALLGVFSAGSGAARARRRTSPRRCRREAGPMSSGRPRASVRSTSPRLWRSRPGPAPSA